MAGIQYLDELFSALRDAAEQVGFADEWLSRTENSEHPAWSMSFLQTAREALDKAWMRLGDAHAQLDALGPADRLPTLLAAMPQRLDELRERLQAADKRLASGYDRIVSIPRGQA